MIEATSCGGVVIFRGKILLLYKNYKNKYEGWVLPKGTVEEGEEYKETAIREVKEETGTDASIIKYIGKSQYTYKAANNYKQKNQTDNEIKLLATKYMREYGLKAHMTGYSYIRDIITASFDYYCKTGSLPKGVYRTIAEKNGVPVQKVERAIRNCIEKGIDENENAKKPTNSQVICRIIEKIRKNN